VSFPPITRYPGLNMERGSVIVTKRLRSETGFSLIETVLVMTVSLIMLAIGLPNFLRAYRSYQLNDAATRVSGILKLTRFEAIRRNIPVICRIQGTAASANIWTDSDATGIEKPTEHQTLLSGGVNLSVAGNIPNTGGLAGAVGAGALTTLSPTNSAVTFDQRGAVNPPAVNVLYIRNPSVPSAGYLAVVLLPSGSIQVWSADQAGNWQIRE
jgi:Tfp pilus assembly protein FimT